LNDVGRPRGRGIQGARRQAAGASLQE
jgi:hypothetical protein